MASELIRMTDLKNWAYCPRVVYYHRVMALRVETAKMQSGVRAQELVEHLELRRTLDRYGLGDAERRFGVWLADDELGLSGRVDLVLVAKAGEEASIVDYKLSSGDPGGNHRMQLHGYALMVESRFAVKVTHAFLYRIPDDKVFEIAIEDAGLARVRTALLEIRTMQDEQACPEPTAVRARCADCEFRNFCSDVW